MTTRRNKRRAVARGGFEPRIIEYLKMTRCEFELEPVTLQYKMTYKPDFRLNNCILVEAKGYFPAEDRQKMLAVKRENPDEDIRFIFQTPHSKCPGLKKLTCAMWAEKHGFQWTGDFEDLVRWSDE